MSAQLDGISRREVLVGAIAAGVSAALPATASAAGHRHKALADDQLLEWSNLSPRSCHSVVPIGGGWSLVAGGLIGSRVTNTTYLIGPDGSIQLAAPLLEARHRHATIGLVDGTVLVLGGVRQDFIMSVESYNPQTDQWKAMPSLPSPRADFSVASAGSGLMLVGGANKFGALPNGFYEIQNRIIMP
jgi:hypothetical protein